MRIDLASENSFLVFSDCKIEYSGKCTNADTFHIGSSPTLKTVDDKNLVLLRDGNIRGYKYSD